MKWKLLGLGIVCLILLAGCGGGAAPAALAPTSTPADPNAVQVESVTLARGDGSGKPGETVTSFKPTDRTFYATVKLNQLKPGLKIKFSWVAVAAAGSANQEIAKQEFSTLTTNTITNTLVEPQDWPTGKYRLDIYVNDSLAKSVDFTVA